jgi:hypothetical protein
LLSVGRGDQGKIRIDELLRCLLDERREVVEHCKMASYEMSKR